MTQQEKIITVMTRNPLKWWKPQDFMQGQPYDPLFVGYEASARLSELAKEYPKMISSRRDGKYMARQINMVTMNSWVNDLPNDLRTIVLASQGRFL